MEMKYNKSYGDNGKNFEEYIEYLDTIKSSIPIKLYNFVSNSSRHDLGSESLHDSRIEKIQFINEFENSKSNMVITLLGENRKFVLQYFNVCKYKIEQEYRINDLLTYEIGLEKIFEDDEIKLVFRADFDDGEIEIFCKEIGIEEILDY